MSMSKKDYEQVAEIISAERMALGVSETEYEDGIREDVLTSLVARMASAFKRDNPQFRADLFEESTRQVRA